MSPQSDVAYDPGSPEVLADPAAAHAELRAKCPVHRFEGLEHPIVTFANRDDVLSVLTDPTTWSNRFGPGVSYGDENIGDLQRYDPPVHAQRRRFLRDPFLPRAVQSMAPSTAELASNLLDQLEPLGRAELHDDYALPLPLGGFIEMMGIADDDIGDFKGWADDLTLGMTYPDRARDARRAMTSYTRTQVGIRRAAVAEAGLGPDEDPVGTVVPDGLLSHLSCHALDDGTLMPDHEVAGMVGQLLVAGHETTTSLIANAVWRLLEDRSRWERLVAEPELAANIVEESLRFDPPVLGLCKTNNVAVEAQGVPIEPDTKVMVLYASANRDADTFEAPDEFRVGRPLVEAKRHLAFGWGEHFCLGAHLARQTARIALAELATRLPGLQPDGPTQRVEAPFLWGRSKLPVRW